MEKALATIDPVTSLTLNPGIIDAMRLVSKIAGTKITTIRTDEQEVQYSQMLVQTKTILKTAEAERKTAVDPLNRAVKSVNDWVRTNFTSPIVAKEGEINNAIRAYRQKKAEEQRKAEEKARKLQEQMQAKADKQGLDIVVPTIIPPAPERITRVEGGQVHERKQWVCELTDKLALIKAVAAGTIPDSALDVNMTVVRNLTKSGIPVPGVKSGYETSMVARVA